MQERWEEICQEKSVFSRLFKIGLFILKCREMGLHEVFDHLIGDHLYEKSATIMYVNVYMPHKRKRRIKYYADLVEMKSLDPDC